MGYDFTGGQIFDFPIDFSMGLTTVQRYCAACDQSVVICLIMTGLFFWVARNQVKNWFETGEFNCFRNWWITYILLSVLVNKCGCCSWLTVRLMMCVMSRLHRQDWYKPAEQDVLWRCRRTVWTVGVISSRHCPSSYANRWSVQLLWCRELFTPPHNGVFNSQSFQDTPKIKTPIGGVLAFASTRPRPASATLLLSVEIYLISSK